MIKVIVNGAQGKMGQETVKAVEKEKELALVAQADLDDKLAEIIKSTKAEVVVDFTHPQSVMGNIRTILESRCHAIIGTTGLTEENMHEAKTLCAKFKVNS